MRKRKAKKVLIIVGGGVYGCVPAHFLSMLAPSRQNLKRVDCLSGCSIGGILAAAYAAGYSFDYVDSFFQQNVDKCFTHRFMARVNPLACPTYSSDGLYEAIDSVLGGLTLGDTRKIYPKLDLFIPALNVTDDRYKVFDNIDDVDVTLNTVAQATSAAPSYFQGVDIDGKCYIDGGLIEVAPLITAATALKGKRGIDFSDMDVLMLGTGKDTDDPAITTEDYNDLGLLGIATKVIVPYATLANELATVYWGNNMGFRSFRYFNPCVHNGQLDDVDQVPDMLSQCDKYRSDFRHTYDDWMFS